MVELPLAAVLTIKSKSSTRALVVLVFVLVIVNAKVVFPVLLKISPLNTLPLLVIVPIVIPDVPEVTDNRSVLLFDLKLKVITLALPVGIPDILNEPFLLVIMSSGFTPPAYIVALPP